ncbi:hypothetical protein EYF80_024256 [Liparis tanakae]|uniref:Uncharacterized protein n=1 Tax=Liparis tanakae TaxID=230148 RepID=A0A4Z2HID0_9TELE|nr:hypothetical protein EYF80_024256 [Liparis tanakae]
MCSNTPQKRVLFFSPCGRMEGFSTPVQLKLYAPLSVGRMAAARPQPTPCRLEDVAAPPRELRHFTVVTQTHVFLLALRRSGFFALAADACASPGGNDGGAATRVYAS